MGLILKCDICGKQYEFKKGQSQDCPYCNGREEPPIQETPPEIHCPKCNSTQITANKKGFGVGKAVAGAVVTGGVGLLAGFIGSGDIEICCLNCGYKFKPGNK